MNDLAALQCEFQRAVLEGSEAFEREIVSTERVDAKRRIGIYADAYRLRLVEVLQDNYPGVHGLVGTEAFDDLARRYIEATPSRFRSARWYGDRFADFLDEAVSTGDRDLLVEMARTDWSMSLAFDAADVEALAESELASIEPQRWGMLVFGFHPAVQRLDLRFDAPPLRGRLATGEDVEPPTSRNEPLPWLFWRQSLRVQFRSMDVDEACALDAAREGAPFAEICGTLVEWVDEQNAPLRAVELLKRWLVDGMIVHYRFAGD